MRILTVKQPWAWAIVRAGKDIENRSRNIAGDYRGPVAIHAGLGKPDQHNLASEVYAKAHKERAGVELQLVYGAIIGVVDLVDVHASKPDHLGVIRCQRGSGAWLGACSEWAMEENSHLKLENPRPLKTPIPFKGSLGLRRLDPAVVAQINKQLTKPARPDGLVAARERSK